MRDNFIVLTLLLGMTFFQPQPIMSQNMPHLNYTIEFNSHWITHQICENYTYNYHGDMIYSISTQSTVDQGWQITSNNDFVNTTISKIAPFRNSTNVQTQDDIKSNLKKIALFPIKSVFVCVDPVDIANIALNSIMMINSESWANSFSDNVKPKYSYYNISTPILKIHLHEMESTSISTPGDHGIGPYTNDPYDIFEYHLYLWQNKFESKYKQNGVTHNPSLFVDNFAKILYSSGSLSNLNIYSNINGKIDGHSVDMFLNLTIVNQNEYYTFENPSKKGAIQIDNILWNLEWIIPVTIVVLSIGIYYLIKWRRQKKERNKNQGVSETGI